MVDLISYSSTAILFGFYNIIIVLDVSINMLLLEYFLYFSILCMYGLNISAGMGLLLFNSVYRRIYESFVIEYPNNIMKKIWNGFYHTTGGGLSYFLYYWLRKQYNSLTVNLLFILYIVIFMVSGLIITTILATSINWIFN
ncbi:hypothetical protein JOC54_002344 [Alkalihalobacillus xiaoxiensis]|uniref:Uncharacterized protein n=1 Tax=Shouchella xiaoxiensis TaxID=766895 RepID=A0ABS2SU61_9BACI|nr:hypothetical protein [Shouchella xiaoxiensis]